MFTVTIEHTLSFTRLTFAQAQSLLRQRGYTASPHDSWTWMRGPLVATIARS